MEIFDLKKIQTQLNKINRDNNISVNVGVGVVLNNIEIYNELIKNFDITQTKNVYIITNLSVTIFNQLKVFNIFPSKIKKSDDKEDTFLKLKKTIENK